MDKIPISIEFNEYFREGKRFLDSWNDWQDFSQKYNFFEKKVNEKFSGRIVRGTKTNLAGVLGDFNLARGTFSLMGLTRPDVGTSIRSFKALPNINKIKISELTPEERSEYNLRYEQSQSKHIKYPSKEERDDFAPK